MYLKIISSLVLIGLINGQQEQNRQGKWIFQPRTVTSYVREKAFITESIPSSCVAVQPSLPPCRHVRQLDIRPNPTEKIEITASPQLLGVPMKDTVSASSSGLQYGPRFVLSSNGYQENRESQDNDPKPLSWAEYFGLEDVTVTKTAVYSVTAKYYDPNTVVTFNVRGCHPSKLPFNLPLCNNNSSSNASSAITPAASTIYKEVPFLP